MKRIKSNPYFIFCLFLASLFAENSVDLEQTIQSAEIVISAFAGGNSKDDFEHRHLTPHLHELTLHGYMLPDDIKIRLESSGYQFRDYKVSGSHTDRDVRSESVGLDYIYDEGIFRFHYTLTGTHAVSSSDYVVQMANVFNHVYDTEVNTMGYIRPPSDGWLPGSYDNGGSEGYDVYIRELATGYYGYVQSEYYSQNTGNNENSPNVQEINAFTSYMAMRNNYNGFPNTELESIQVTAAHEFFHAIQYGYDGWEKPWLLEATAVWMEDELYDNINDCYQYLVSWFNIPEESLDKTGGTHWYGSYIYFEHIGEHLGGSETVKRIFEEGVNTDSKESDFSHQAISDGLAPMNSSFADALNKMAIANRILSSSPGPGAEIYSYEEAEDFPMLSPRIYTTKLFSEGNTTTINSTSLKAFGSQYSHIITDTPIYAELTNLDGPQSDLQLSAILKTTAGYHLVKMGNPLNIDPGSGYEWLTLVVVSQDDIGNDFDYSIEITDGFSEVEPPFSFSLNQPESGQTIQTLSPTLSWHPSGSLNVDDVLLYKLAFGVNPESMDTVYIGQDTSYSITEALTNHTLYHWSVFAENLSGVQITNDGGVSSFFTMITPLPDKQITISKPYPNPFPLSGTTVSRTRIQIILQEDEKIDVSVVNLSGQTVATLFTGNLDAGCYDHFSWDGRIANGEKAPSGVYFIRIKSNSTHTWRKATLLH